MPRGKVTEFYNRTIFLVPLNAEKNKKNIVVLFAANPKQKRIPRSAGYTCVKRVLVVYQPHVVLLFHFVSHGIIRKNIKIGTRCIYYNTRRLIPFSTRRLSIIGVSFKKNII